MIADDALESDVVGASDPQLKCMQLGTSRQVAVLHGCAAEVLLREVDTWTDYVDDEGVSWRVMPLTRFNSICLAPLWTSAQGTMRLNK